MGHLQNLLSWCYSVLQAFLLVQCRQCISHSEQENLSRIAECCSMIWVCQNWTMSNMVTWDFLWKITQFQVLKCKIFNFRLYESSADAFVDFVSLLADTQRVNLVLINFVHLHHGFLAFLGWCFIYACEWSVGVSCGWSVFLNSDCCVAVAHVQLVCFFSLSGCPLADKSIRSMLANNAQELK